VPPPPQPVSIYVPPPFTAVPPCRLSHEKHSNVCYCAPTCRGPLPDRVCRVQRSSSAIRQAVVPLLLSDAVTHIQLHKDVNTVANEPLQQRPLSCYGQMLQDQQGVESSGMHMHIHFCIPEPVFRKRMTTRKKSHNRTYLLKVTSPTSGGRSVGIVCLQTKKPRSLSITFFA
jgi:hypothetical protein